MKDSAQNPEKRRNTQLWEKRTGNEVNLHLTLLPIVILQFIVANTWKMRNWYRSFEKQAFFVCHCGQGLRQTVQNSATLY